jgi:hypothetical protein
VRGRRCTLCCDMPSSGAAPIYGTIGKPRAARGKLSPDGLGFDDDLRLAGVALLSAAETRTASDTDERALATEETDSRQRFDSVTRRRASST